MGGGFGAKFDDSLDGVLAARLSREAKAPVRMMLTRFDNALAVGNRPSTFQKIKIGAKADGTLHAFEMENYGTAGINGGDVDIPAPYIYAVPNTRVKQTHRARQCRRVPRLPRAQHPPASSGMEGRHGRSRRQARHGPAGIPAEK